MLSSVESFGQWVRLRRKKLKLTQKQLGKMTGYAEITIRQIESDTYKLSPFIVENLVNYLADEQDDSILIKQFALNQLPETDPHTPNYKNSLYQTSFFGRRAELETIRDLLQNPDCRCISIVGIGGMGKTRLAAHAVSTIANGAFQGSAFVNLTEATNIEQAARMIATTAGIALTPFASVASQVLRALTSRDLLLVLDNFEQLLPEGVEFLTAILEQSSGTKIVVTSREQLQIRGEWSIRLQGLGMTEASPLTDAVDLFISTAQRMNNAFVPLEMEEIQAICHLLQGIPLAIEMAASWINVHTCAEILNNVTNNALELTSRYRDVDERHKSLQAVFETTWGRLSVHEQKTLMRLAVFRGGFDLPAAQNVALADKTIVAFLQEKMLVQPQHDGRLTLHEMIRQLALQKLMLDTQEWDDTHTAHAEYFVRLFSGSADHIKYMPAREAVYHIVRELENMTIAWSTMLAKHRTDWFEMCWEGMWLFFNVTSRFREGEDWFRAVITAFAASSPDTEEKQIANFTQVLAASFLLRQGRVPESYALLYAPHMDTIHRSTKHRDRYYFYFLQSYVLHALGNAQEALIRGEEGLQEVKLMEKDPYHLITAYYQMGRIHHLLGNSETAYQYLSNALHLYRENRLGWGMGLVLTELGLVAETTEQIDVAISYYEAVLAAVAEWEEIWNYYRTRISIGRVKLALGQTQEATSIFHTTLQGLQDNPQIGLEIDCFVEAALVLKQFGHISWALLLLEYCSQHTECFQPVRDRAAEYLKRLRVQVPVIDVSAARNLFPVHKRDVAALLIDRLSQIQQNLPT